MGRARTGVAEGASNNGYESLRQKDSYMTHLWRVPFKMATNEESRKVNFQVQGQRFSILKGAVVFFLLTNEGRKTND
jgi:predicted O-linked N-acetylglucosamine transferase (SPINDLY family)